MKMDAEVALLPGAEEVKNAELIKTIQSNLEEVDRMSRITQFLLDFSSTEHGRARLGFSRVSLGAIVGNVVKMMGKAAAEKNVTLTFTQENGTVMINGNTVALEEMILNLVKNAVNYTPSGGSVRVELIKRGYQGYGWATLAVRDTGVGIPAEDIPRLFEPFYRGKNIRVMRTDHSAGLGLAIVQEIASLHKAPISVTSEMGKGTNISLRFSLLRA
jgi:signal transduction histidine kinase